MLWKLLSTMARGPQPISGAEQPSRLRGVVTRYPKTTLAACRPALRRWLGLAETPPPSILRLRRFFSTWLRDRRPSREKIKETLPVWQSHTAVRCGKPRRTRIRSSWVFSSHALSGTFSQLGLHPSISTQPDNPFWDPNFYRETVDLGKKE